MTDRYIQAFRSMSDRKTFHHDSYSTALWAGYYYCSFMTSYRNY